MNEETLEERQSSIEISRNQKNQYTWKIKYYYDPSTTTKENAVEYVADLNKRVKNKFIGG